MVQLWNDLAAAAGVRLDEPQQQLLQRYLDLLLAANATMNLTALDDMPAAQAGHVGDALTLLPFLPPGAHRLADVGSGGGVPGIPLAIARPDAQVTLIESTQKKAAFLQRTATELGLRNVAVLPQRCEEITHGPQRESFDRVVARALAPLVLLVEWCLPLVRPGGMLLAMKGAKIELELPAAQRAIRVLNGAEPIVHPVSLPGAEKHVVVAIAKLGRTDPRFPRATGQAKKRPL